MVNMVQNLLQKNEAENLMAVAVVWRSVVGESKEAPRGVTSFTLDGAT